jgi:DNA-binding response OmpR family regulator
MAEALSLLLLTEDVDQATALSEQLALDPEMKVQIADRPVRFARLLDAERVDIALVLAGSSDAISDLRLAGYRGPVLVLGGSDEAVDGIEKMGLPSRFSVIVARIRGVIRSFEAREDPWLTIGGFRLMLGSKMLVDQKGKAEKLTDKEADILRFMHRAGGDLVAREVLLTEIWGYNERVSTHTLETHIYRLRQKIEQDPAHAELLVTELGGYRLVELPEGERPHGA